MDEAARIVGNMCRMSAYHGTTTTDVVDEILSRFSNPIFCNGRGRNMVFVPVTHNTMAFKTEPADIEE